MNESDCKFVSSRGILKSCDKHNRNPQSSSRHIDEDLFHNLKDYDIVHICSWLTITLFVQKFVPKLTKKVIMVTNDSDMDAPIFEKPVGKGDEIAKEEIRKFLDSDLCVHWFTQNCTLEHPKVSPIPIGMDYHTFSNQISCKDQEKMIMDISSLSTPFYQREMKCYSNSHFNIHGKYYTQERVDCIQQVPKNLTHYEQRMINRKQTWLNQTRFAFVLSPAGGGIDCHRTWEALILGCIPIVKRFQVPNDKLYEDLPVLVIDKWSDINEDLLRETVDTFKTKSFKYEKLNLKYWIDLFNSYKQQ
jgi:hypothetical protein